MDFSFPVSGNLQLFTVLFVVCITSLTAPGAQQSPSASVDMVMAGTYFIRVYNPGPGSITAHIDISAIDNGKLDGQVGDKDVLPGQTEGLGVVFAVNPAKPVTVHYQLSCRAAAASAHIIAPPTAPLPSGGDGAVVIQAPSPSLPTRLTRELVKEWAMRDPFAKPPQEVTHTPEPIPDIDWAKIPNLHLTSFFRATNEKPYDIDICKIGVGGDGMVAVNLTNRSKGGLAIDYTLVDAGGGSPLEKLNAPIHAEVGEGEAIRLLRILGNVDPAKVRTEMKVTPCARLRLQDIVAQYEAYGWRAGGPTPELEAKLTAAVPHQRPTGTPISFPTARDAAQYAMRHPGVMVCGPDGKPFGMTHPVNTSIPEEYFLAKRSLFMSEYIKSHPGMLGMKSREETDREWAAFYDAWMRFAASTTPWIKKPPGYRAAQRHAHE